MPGGPTPCPDDGSLPLLGRVECVIDRRPAPRPETVEAFVKVLTATASTVAGLG